MSTPTLRCTAMGGRFCTSLAGVSWPCLARHWPRQTTRSGPSWRPLISTRRCTTPRLCFGLLQQQVWTYVWGCTLVQCSSVASVTPSGTPPVVIGDTAVLAAAVEQTAEPGTIMCSDATACYAQEVGVIEV